MKLYPKVVHTYRTSCKTVAQPPGFGDFLRGTITLFELSRKYQFDLRYITTHAVPVNQMDSECQDFVKKRVSPTTEVELHLRSLLSEFGLNNFCVLHLRMGDQAFETDITS